MKPTWDRYFLDMLEPLSRRSSCIRQRFSSLIVLDNRIIATGYNGTPKGVKNCDEGGCERCASGIPSGAALEICLCSHAEENSIVQCALNGISCDGGTLYTQKLPCLTCAKMIINAGIKLIVIEQLDIYPGSDRTASLLSQAGVSFILGV